MCKLIKYKGRSSNPKIDECIKELIFNLKRLLRDDIQIKACCCGHKKYPMTIVVTSYKEKYAYELVSGIEIKRYKRFYKRDNEGYYYIPEVVRGRRYY